ncbi:hypothetical protein [Haladaptatus halobius]|uniref:hypothetical protein n=1 Tax=Haladaptatus halobius TaxID=2884875 RepID=UPI001D0B4CD0|nr:hypothetical protein [Haladaptatus halobius]
MTKEPGNATSMMNTVPSRTASGPPEWFDLYRTVPSMRSSAAVPFPAAYTIF